LAVFGFGRDIIDDILEQWEVNMDKTYQNIFHCCVGFIAFKEV